MEMTSRLENLIKSADKFEEKLQEIRENLDSMNSTFKEYKKTIVILKTENEDLKNKFVNKMQGSQYKENDHSQYSEMKISNSNWVIKSHLNSISKNTWSLSKFEDIINELLELGYDGFQMDDYGNNPLHYAVKYGYTDIAKCLIDHYVDIDIDDTIFNKPLHIIHKVGDSIFDKSKYWNSNLIKIINLQDAEGKSSLYYAVERKDYDMACTLLLHGGYVTSVNTEYQKELLRYTAEITHATNYEPHKLRTVVGLLAIKVPDAVCHFKANYEYPRLLSYYFMHGHIKVIDALLNAIKDNEKKKQILNTVDNGATPFDRVNNDILGDLDHLKIVKYLLKHGATKTANNVNHIYLTLKCAACNGHIETFKYVMEQGDKKNCNTYIGLACKHNQMNIVDYLWKNYPQYTTDRDGNTALHYAIDSGSLESIMYLYDKGADIHAVNSSGQSPIHYALKKYRNEVINYLMSRGIKF